MTNKKKRFCYLCDKEIFESMGSVLAGSFLSFLKDQTVPVKELCPRCVFQYVLQDDLKEYPKPPL